MGKVILRDKVGIYSSEDWWDVIKMVDEIAKAGYMHQLVGLLHSATGSQLPYHYNVRQLTTAVCEVRYAAHFKPPTKMRLGCLRCGDTFLQAPPDSRLDYAIDLATVQCKRCSAYDLILSSELKLLYKTYGGLLDES